MRQRVIRIIVLGIAGLVVLAAAALGFFVATFDPNQYLDRIGAAVKKATGKELRVEGTVEMALFPQPGIKIGRALLLDDPAFGEGPLLSVEEASLAIALKPLFDGILAIEDIELSGARMRLVRNPDGRGNWETGPKASPRPAEPGVTPLRGPAGAEAAESESPSRKGFEARINRIQGKELIVSYHDKRNGDSFTLTVDSLKAQDVILGADTLLLLAGALRDDGSGRRAAFSLDATARFSADGDAAATVNALRLVVEGFAEEPLTVECTTAISYEKARERLNLTDISASISLAPQRATLAGNLSWRVPGDGAEQELTGALRLGDLDLDAWRARLRAPAPGADNAAAGGAARGAPNMPRPTVAGHTAPQRGGAESGSGASAAFPFVANLNVDLALDAASLTVEGLPLRQVSLSVRLRDGKAEAPCTFRIYNGAVDGVFKADLGGKTTTVGIDCAVKNLDLGLATANAQKSHSVTGLLDASLNVTGQGRDAQALLHGLAGKASARAKGGEIRGFSLIPPDLRGLKAVPVDFSYSSMSASAVIKEGVATSRDISLISNTLTGRGGGVVRLAFKQLDIGIDFMLAGMPPAVPVGISGPFSSLSASVDMRTFLRNVAETGVKSPGEAAKGILRGVDGLLFRQ